jgi:CRP/FNR family cyclic AMP-dependent transcriptional regulator
LSYLYYLTAAFIQDVVKATKAYNNGVENRAPIQSTENFTDTGLSNIMLLFENTSAVPYKAGQIIFMPEDPSCEKLYLLKDGRIQMYRITADGKKLLTRQVLPGSIFGVRGILGRAMQGNFAEAAEDSTVYSISWDEIMVRLKQRPDIILSILERVCSRLALLEDRLVRAAYSPVIVRLAYFILANADPVSGVLSNLTHEEIANTIGSVRQTVTENLSQMRKQGLLEIGSRKIRILDRKRLEKIVHGPLEQRDITPVVS